MTRQEAIDKAVKYFEEGYACSQSVLLAFAEELKLDPRVAKLISGTFGGGMGRLRNKCGALTGSFMVLGMAQGYDDPKDMETKMDVYKKVRLITMEDTRFLHCNIKTLKMFTLYHDNI